MTRTTNKIKDDILIISYYFKQNSWQSANKVSYQRVLYFSAVLAPVFIKNPSWDYDFSNTLFGPYNNEISDSIQSLYVKGDLSLINRNIYQNRIEESFLISEQGIQKCKRVILLLNVNKSKSSWFRMIVKALTLYGEQFLSKLVKVDPNVVNMNLLNNTGKISADDSEDNISKEFFLYLKKQGIHSLKIDDDLNILLMFFDVLFRKYRGSEE